MTILSIRQIKNIIKISPFHKHYINWGWVLTSTAANDLHRQGFQPPEILTLKKFVDVVPAFLGGPGGLSMLFLIAYENVKKTWEKHRMSLHMRA